jgi:DNA-binding MarR family transcriptional regulator
VRWLTDREQAAWLDYIGASRLLDRRIEEQLKADGQLSHSQYEILAHLSGSPGARTRMTELAEWLVVGKSALTYQIDQLARRGLVRREACAGDDRGIFAVLTEEGMRCLERVAPGHVEVVRANMIDHLTPEELDVLARVMAKVRAAATKPASGARSAPPSTPSPAS